MIEQETTSAFDRWWKTHQRNYYYDDDKGCAEAAWNAAIEKARLVVANEYASRSDKDSDLALLEELISRIAKLKIGGDAQ